MSQEEYEHIKTIGQEVGYIFENNFDNLDDNYKLKNKFIAIVHGVSGGKIKSACHDELRRNKKVQDYGICYFNQGCTIVCLNL